MRHIVELDPELPRLTFRQWYETIAAIGEDLDRVLSFPQWAKLAGLSDRTGRVISEDLDRVLSFPQWARLAGLSERTGREIIERGDGPKVVQLSPNRIGIRVCDHREWLAARTRKAQHLRAAANT